MKIKTLLPKAWQPMQFLRKIDLENDKEGRSGNTNNYDLGIKHGA